MGSLVEKEIHVLGVQRTGQHGVIAWLLGHFDRVCFKNDMSSIGEDRHRGVEPPFWYFDLTKDQTCKWSESNNPDIRGFQEAVVLGTEFVRPEVGFNPEIETQKQLMAERLRYDTFSDKRYNLLVIRSPHNHYASVLGWHRNRRLRNPSRFCYMWKIFAREYLGITECIDRPKRFVIYDEWFVSEEYRKGVSEFIEQPFTDRWLNVVMRIGAGRKFGSSFDEMNRQSQAQSMDVLNRWQQYRNDDLFKQVFQDEELIELSEQIFGPLPL